MFTKISFESFFFLIFYLITIFSGKPIVQESVDERCFAAVLHAQEDDLDLGLRHPDLVACVAHAARVTHVTVVKFVGHVSRQERTIFCTMFP